jgi:hypothetical protein
MVLRHVHSSVILFLVACALVPQQLCPGASATTPGLSLAQRLRGGQKWKGGSTLGRRCRTEGCRCAPCTKRSLVFEDLSAAAASQAARELQRRARCPRNLGCHDCPHPLRNG